MLKFLGSGILALMLYSNANAGSVVIPEDKVPFTIQMDDTVRVPVKGIAGTTVTAKVTGAAEATVNSVSTRRKGQMPIGPGNQEVEVKASGKGKVTVVITISPPNGKPTTETYKFTVE